MALIETIQLKKTYTTGNNVRTDALRGVSLQIAEGEFLAIAGPSGSGKSSLLNLMGALDTPTSGTVLLDNQNISEINSQDLAAFRLHHIGFIFQAYNLINTLTAVENVEYVMLLQGVDQHTRESRSEAILERVGLADYMNRFPHEMSGGQQQRIAVARAMAAEPRVVLADEPTANLDSKTAQELLDLMAELNREKGITFVFSTHDRLIMERAQRLITLKDGVIIP
ncbi:MAG TPA: ABC transporter ATP-binding protein [Candidatus Omnitrophota bacterium]|nr:ABC transporter ATP-binding protein [Candidatus Omnitrophota bacterium]HQO57920.1 ABC transporter ATP-binding protein [Candidatus Omnitrophota bacterium]HQP11574.1 ABC transporter ATP-binding protein [Candidatus Omnitrophota bacterium]